MQLFNCANFPRDFFEIKRICNVESVFRGNFSAGMIEYTKCSPGMCDKHALFLIQIELRTFIGEGKLHNSGLFRSEVQTILLCKGALVRGS